RASAQLAIAEQRLAELRESGTASQSTMMAAEQRVTEARRSLAKATEDLGQKSETAMGQMVQSAREHSGAWSTAGGALLTYGVAVTGITAAILAQGISYN